MPNDFMVSPPSALDPGQLAGLMLDWYDRHRRVLPWRAPPGEAADPYAVWLSEIMLQQTTVVTVAPYFGDFMTRWPTVEALAAASLDEVLHAWQGLGYYARARNLHACAKVVATAHGGRFPPTEAELRTLPGIGPYTAAAIAAIAFGARATVVDGNVERVMARLHAVGQPLPAAKPLLVSYAERLTPAARAGDYAQAVMDLGATICTPRQPRCLVCPWRPACRAAATDQPERYPVKTPKPERPVRHGTVFWITRPDGAVLLRRREEKGLLGGLMEFPSTPWTAVAPKEADPAASPVAGHGWHLLPGEVRHVFTHFELRLRILAGEAAGATDGPWVRPDRFGDYALPTLMKKVAAFALAASARGR